MREGIHLASVLLKRMLLNDSQGCVCVCAHMHAHPRVCVCLRDELLRGANGKPSFLYGLAWPSTKKNLIQRHMICEVFVQRRWKACASVSRTSNEKKRKKVGASRRRKTRDERRGER